MKKMRERLVWSPLLKALTKEITSSATCRGWQPSGSESSSLVTITRAGSWKTTGSRWLPPLPECAPPASRSSSHPTRRQSKTRMGRIADFERESEVALLSATPHGRFHSTANCRGNDPQQFALSAPCFGCKLKASLQRDQAEPGALADSFGAIAYRELGVERGDVELDRMFAYVELPRDHLVRQPVSEQVQHLALAGGQWIRELFDGLRFVEQPFSQGLREHGQAMRYRGNGGPQLFCRGVRCYDAPTPERQGTQPGRLALVLREQQQRLRAVLGDGEGGLLEHLLVSDEYHIGPGERGDGSGG